MTVFTPRLSDAALKRQAAVNALKSLEEKQYPTTIANFLSDLRIVGKRHSAERCPIARYLTAEVGETVCVGNDSCAVMVLEPTETGPVYHKLGPAVLQFIRMFDAGVYPDLDVEKQD